MKKDPSYILGALVVVGFTLGFISLLYILDRQVPKTQYTVTQYSENGTVINEWKVISKRRFSKAVWRNGNFIEWVDKETGSIVSVSGNVLAIPSQIENQE